MIGSYILGASMFRIYNSMYSTAFDVLIKNLESLSTSNPNSTSKDLRRKEEKR